MLFSDMKMHKVRDDFAATTFEICSPRLEKKIIVEYRFLHFFCFTSFPLYFLERTAVEKTLNTEIRIQV